jgi:protein-S-isoprenylcysteine O-methyltransferase Ste14
MDPINILVGLNIIATFAANLTGAKKGLKSTLSDAKERPKTYLQKLPLILAAITLLSMIIGVFHIGTSEYKEDYKSLRLAGLLIYLIFSWVQIWAYKTLGESYSQEIVMFKNHQLITKGPFKYIRHPQYLSQILMDIGGGLALLSYIALPLAVFEIPFVMMRASLEERMLERNFKEAFIQYKNKSGFMIPFIG